MLFHVGFVASATLPRTAKGNLVNIPGRRYLREIARQRNETATRLDGNREESSFLFNESRLHPRKSFAERMGQALGKAKSILSLFGHLITPLENRRVQL